MDSFFYITTEASMEDSYIYNMFNDANQITRRLVQVLKDGIRVTPDKFEEQYLQIKKSHMSPLIREVMDAYDNGDIEIIRNENNVKIPTSLPFIVRRAGTRVISTIFISSFTTVDEDGNLGIAARALYSIMESAYIGRLYHVNPARLLRNSSLARLMCEIYLNMYMRVLNRDYAISLEKDLYNNVMYVVSKFFYKNMWEMNDENSTNYAISMLPPSRNMIILNETIEAYEQADVKSIPQLFEFIRGMAGRMKDLNIRLFIERWINSYNASAILAMDYLPYLFFVVSSTLLGSFLVSQKTISDIIKNTKRINSYYSELSK